MRRPFKSQPEGVQVSLSTEELGFLTSLPGLLAGVDEDPADPGHARLHIAAYPDDQPAQLELEAITGPDLAAIRSSDRDSFLSSITRVGSDDGLLSPEEAEGWLTVLGDSRLALAARLGINQPGWETAGDETNPAQAALGFLSYLQSELVEVLMDDL